jgi:hypothetical protein
MDLTTDGEATDVTPAHLNVRTRVHEYGGGHLLVSPDGNEVRSLSLNLLLQSFVCVRPMSYHFTLTPDVYCLVLCSSTPDT